MMDLTHFTDEDFSIYREMKTCESCKHLSVQMPTHDIPYIEIYCIPKDWDGVEDIEQLKKEIDCDRWEEI